MTMSSDSLFLYTEWCRICGSIEGSSDIQEDVLNLIEILEISLENIKICRECNQQLENTNALVKKAKQLERLFNGLKEENDPDLTITRINAYREHFNLDPIIIAEIEIEIATADDKVETEENLESLEEESIVIESLEESLIIEDEFEVEEEVYIELEEECQISEDSPNAEVDNPLQKISAIRLRKTENEKLFNFRCHICSDQEFENMRLLGKHCKDNHNCLPKVKCCSDDCSAVLHTWRRLMIHKEKHFPNDNQIKCPECQQVFVTTVGLEKHMKKHLTALICSKCGKKSKDPKSLRWHEASHEKSLEERQKYDCPYPNCGVKFITKQAQQDHIAARHEKVISCYCDYPNCDRGFYTKKAYHEHVKNAHSERTLRCDHCNFKARTKTALKNHNAVHSVGDLYQCDICNVTFAAYRRLKAHMICHSDAHPFRCPVCQADFKRSKDLKSHSFIHTKERPFACQFCTRRFANAGNVRKHRLKLHAEELKQWETENGVGGRKKLECYQ